MSRGTAGVVAALLVASAAYGCAEDEDSAGQAAALAQRAEAFAAHLGERSAADSGVVVRLAFGEEADLDLYVTDPLLETVYFARHESRTGGRIAADVRCDTPGARVEEVRFEAPWPGRYRVGVDHPKRCDGAPSPAPAAYAVTAWADGKTYRAQGSVAVEQFEVVVLEFEVQEGATHERPFEIN